MPDLDSTATARAPAPQGASVRVPVWLVVVGVALIVAGACGAVGYVVGQGQAASKAEATHGIGPNVRREGGPSSCVRHQPRPRLRPGHHSWPRRRQDRRHAGRCRCRQEGGREESCCRASCATRNPVGTAVPPTRPEQPVCAAGPRRLRAAMPARKRAQRRRRCRLCAQHTCAERAGPHNPARLLPEPCLQRDRTRNLP